MKSILCYGDSNTWGCIPLPGLDPASRFPPATRWPGVLRRELGDGYWIVEAGLNGRTTVWDDPLEPHRNGRKLLLPTLLTHQPLDLVIIMLGTNDLKHRLNASAAEIAEGAGMLVDIVTGSGCGPDTCRHRLEPSREHHRHLAWPADLSAGPGHLATLLEAERGDAGQPLFESDAQLHAS